ncbi:hypothetical protein AYO44_12090 [Planctomycetaceae bacterium SCGC AG-212-F19]|nr:hypothetical protein AYO44_12090 [Planctomycetaceae bacterium SCGC AG-212-F19]
MVGSQGFDNKVGESAEEAKLGRDDGGVLPLGRVFSTRLTNLARALWLIGYRLPGRFCSHGGLQIGRVRRTAGDFRKAVRDGIGHRRSGSTMFIPVFSFALDLPSGASQAKAGLPGPSLGIDLGKFGLTKYQIGA